MALENHSGPSFIAFSRQGVPQLAGSSIEKVALGAYVLSDEADAKVVLVGTGTEVSLCVEAAEKLKGAGIAARVVSMPCWSLFDAQSAAYRASVFPEGTPVLSVEALTSLGWEKVCIYAIAPYVITEVVPGLTFVPRWVSLCNVTDLCASLAHACLVQYAHAHVAMNTFGASGKGPALMTHFGFTVDNVCDKATKLVKFYAGGPAPSLSRPEL